MYNFIVEEFEPALHLFAESRRESRRKPCSMSELNLITGLKQSNLRKFIEYLFEDRR